MPAPAAPDAVLPDDPEGPMAPMGEEDGGPDESRWRRWWRQARRGSGNGASDDDGGCGDCDLGWEGCDICDGCDGCSPGCDLMRLSTVLFAVAVLHPGGAPGRAVALGAIRFYRRRISRFTPACPATPSCAAYAEDAVRRDGARRGLAAAARRIRACPSTPPDS